LSPGVTYTAGSGISIIGTTISNAGVTSLTGTTNQVSVSASTGGVTISLPQDISTSSTPTFSQVTISGSVVNPTDTATKQYVDTAVTPTSETLTLTSVSQPINPNLNYTFLNNTAKAGISWTTQIAGLSAAFPNSNNCVASDATGIYVTGYYDQTTNVYNSGGSIGTTLTLTGTNDCYVAKYDFTGNVLWVARMGAAAGITQGTSITTSSSGVYVTGKYDTALTIRNASGSVFTTLAKIGGNDCFVVKYDASGNGVWAARIAGSNDEIGYGIVADATGMYVTGSYSSNPVSIYNSSGAVFTTLASVGASVCCFVAKYDSASGSVDWATRLGATVTGAAGTIGFSVAVDSTSGFYVTGYYDNNMDIYSAGGSLFTSLTFTGSYTDVFVVKYDKTTGAGTWATKLSSASADYGNGISTDATGVYVVGRCDTGPMTVYNSNGSTFATITGNNQSYLVKYDTNGTGLWSTTITGGSFGQGVTTDSTGVYVTGYYTSSATILNSDASTFSTLALLGANSFYAVKYTPTGFGIWASRAGGSGANSAKGFSIVTDSVGGTYAVGYYNASTSFFNPDGSIFTTMSNASTNSTFIIKYQNTTTVLASMANPSSLGRKVIALINGAFGGVTANITVSNLLYQGTTNTLISLNQDGDSIELGWTGSLWYVISNNGSIIS